MTPCKYASLTDKDCGCSARVKLIRCENAARTDRFAALFDAAALSSKREDGATLTPENYCNATHCQDYEASAPCVYATVTKQPWAGKAVACVVVECRSQAARDGGLICFKDKNGVEYPGVRRPCDEQFNLIPNAGYLHVRSRFCNALWRPFYQANNKEE